jgi:hypothetical protein
MGKPASPVTFNPAAFGANSCPAPDSYYHIDEGTGTTLTNIGKDTGSFDGTITGADWGTEDGSTKLTGVSANVDVVEFPIQGITGYPFSFAVWAKKTITGSASGLLHVGDESASQVTYGIDTFASDRVAVVVQNGGSLLSDVSNGTAQSNILDVYHMVVVAFDSATSRRIYVANDSTATATTSVAFDAGVDFMTLFARARGTDGDTNGDYAVVGLAVWKSVALTADQVTTDLYNGGSWPPFVTTSSGIAVPAFQGANLNSFIR